MNKIIALLSFVLISGYGYGQLNTNSPYSIYGIGDEIFSTLTSQAAMGHTSIAVRNPLNINTINPAGLSQLGRVTFNFDVKNEFLNLSTSSSSESKSLLTVNNFSFGFPLINDFSKKRRSTLTMGVKPYTSQGYNLETSESVPNLGDITYRFIGNGGISDAFLGLSYDLISIKRSNKTKNINIPRSDVLSIGATSSYIFGTIDRARITDLNLSSQASSIYRQQILELSDFNARIGLLYSHAILSNDTIFDKLTKENVVRKKTKGHFSIGAYYNPSLAIGTYMTAFNYSYVGEYTNPKLIDTLEYQSIKTAVQTPSSYGIGISLSLNNSLTLAADFNKTMWSDLKINEVNEVLNDAQRFSLGAEYLPQYDATGKSSFTKTIRYRGGISYQQTRLKVNGAQPNRYGINFGLGIPLIASKSTSIFNFGLEVANRGSKTLGLNETYVNLNFGFTLTPFAYDLWFAKRKYD